MILSPEKLNHRGDAWGGKSIVKVEALKTNEFLNENQCENHYEDDGKE